MMRDTIRSGQMSAYMRMYVRRFINYYITLMGWDVINSVLKIKLYDFSRCFYAFHGYTIIINFGNINKKTTWSINLYDQY